MNETPESVQDLFKRLEAEAKENYQKRPKSANHTRKNPPQNNKFISRKRGK